MATFNRLYSRNFDALKALHADPVRHATRCGCRRRWAGTATPAAPSAATTSTTSTPPAPRPRTTCTCSTGTPTTPPTCRTPSTRTCGRCCGSTRTGSSCRTTSGYYMATSNAHETYWDVRNAITDLAAVRLLVPDHHPGQPPSSTSTAGCAPQWQDLLDNLAAPVPGGRRRLAAARPARTGAAAQRRERVCGADLAVRPHRHRRARLPDRAQHLEQPAQPLQQRVGQRRTPRRPGSASATRPSTA